jgi:hypothetical protein
MVREELTSIADIRDEEMIPEDVWVDEAKQCKCLVSKTLVTLVNDHWSLVICDDPNLFADNSMETPRFYQVAVGLVGE